jgi:CHASE1-domain containing sensor protein
VLPLTQSLLRDARAAWFVLAAGLMITAAATCSMWESVERLAEHDFSLHVKEYQRLLSRRLDDHARILQSGAALFQASDSVTRADWHAFAHYLQLEKQLPGIQGMGFALLIPRAELSRHLLSIRHEGFPAYTVRPEGDRDIYTSIIYLEPFTNRNLRAFGYDMFSEPVRRIAMERARDTGSAALSGKVVLVQETDTDVQAGSLMYVPVYRNGSPVDTVEERRAALLGWVYSPYRMTDLIQGLLGDRNLEQEKQLHLEIFDGDQPSSQNRLYRCHPAEHDRIWPAVRHTQFVPIAFNGHCWTLSLAQT